MRRVTVDDEEEIVELEESEERVGRKRFFRSGNWAIGTNFWFQSIDKQNIHIVDKLVFHMHSTWIKHLLYCCQLCLHQLVSYKAHAALDPVCSVQ